MVRFIKSLLIILFFGLNFIIKFRHDGCECSEEFEGEFCEYIKGEAPTKRSTSGLMIGLIATFATLTAVSGVFIIRKLQKKSPKSIETVGVIEGGDSDVKIHQMDTEMT